jgi:peptidoglycan hydrolase CwlO-like protein
MDWLQNKTTQFIALAGIIGTLAGFGYTGATYVNRIENLETKAQQAKETEQGVDEVINRIEALETSVSYMNKIIDETILIKIDSQSNKVEEIKSDMSGMKADIESVKTDIKIFKEENKNPLAG